MKEMVYQEEPTIELLDRGTYKNYEYAVMSLGTHPCGYVKIPEGHPYYGLKYGSCCIECHGGLTYGRNYLRTSRTTEEKGWWLGWDYNHLHDYNGSLLIDSYTKHSTLEIRQECFRVIDQLIEIEKENGNASKTIN